MTQPAPDSRRGFLKFCTHALGALFSLVLGVPAAMYLVDARNRKGLGADAAKGPDGQALPIYRAVDGVDLEVLLDKPQGTVMQAAIRDVREDAWTLHPNDVLGRIWVIKTGPGKEVKDLEVLSADCPHLGCFVNFTSGTFTCPCHGGCFQLNGDRVVRPDQPNPAPRGMDTLEKKADPNNPRILLVDYKKFKQLADHKEVV